MNEEKSGSEEAVPTGGSGGEGGTRGRPGKRSVEEKRQAVLDVLSGKATVAQVARRLCVLPETVESWREEALDAMTAAFRQGPTRS